MEFYITQCIAGFIAFNQDFEIVKMKLFEENEIVENLIRIEENEILDEEIELINELELNCDDKVIIETTKRRSQFKSLENYENLIVETPNNGGEYLRENLEDILIEIGFLSENEDYRELIQHYEELAINQIKKSSQEEDKLLIQAINSVDDIDESISKLVERIRGTPSISLKWTQ